jgi:hypothetical protein
VQVDDAGNLVRERCEFVEMRGKQTQALDGGANVLGYGPRKAESIVGRRSTTQLIDDDERIRSGGLASVAIVNEWLWIARERESVCVCVCVCGSTHTLRMHVVSNISAMNVDTPRD